MSKLGYLIRVVLFAKRNTVCEGLMDEGDAKKKKKRKVVVTKRERS